MLSLSRLVPVFPECPRKMYFEVHPSFMILVRSVPFTAVNRVKTGAFYSVFGNGRNLNVCIGFLKDYGFLFVLNLLDKSFEFCVSANLDLYLLVNIIYVLDGESPVFAVKMS